MDSRRTFLAGLGAAALAPHALSALSPGHGPFVPPSSGEYVVGVTSNPLLPGPAGELVLKTWLSVAADGTGFGILTRRYDPQSSSHLAVQSAVRNVVLMGQTFSGQGRITG